MKRKVLQKSHLGLKVLILLELKQSITDRKTVVAQFNDKLNFFSQIIKDELDFQRETL